MENNFSAENSLRLIAETIERSRRTIAKNSGKPLILWGSLVALTAVIIYILWSLTGSPAWNFLWFAMSAIGAVCMRSMTRNSEKVPDSEISRTLGKIWMWFGIFSTGFFALVWAAWGVRCAVGIEGPLRVDLTLVILLMMGLCGTLSGAVLKFKPITVSSVVATALSALFLMVMPDASPVRILTFAILGVFALIVPGVILQKQVK
ncbi:MAG: hypothetical protein IJU08_03490 [Bacteroidales bacterium]|nr:hypothetical protein [Bacteroidales bacterium]